MRKWLSIIAIMLCLCLCFGLVYAEKEGGEEPTPETDVDIIDFSFNVTSVSEEFYSLLKTDVPRKDLSLLHFKYYDWDGDERNGIIIVRSELEFDALDALQDVYEAHILLDDISLFAGDGLGVDFWAVLEAGDPEEDTCNVIFDNYGFAHNDNQADGCRAYDYYGLENKWIP